MKRILLIIFSSLLLSGCAPTIWYKDGATQADFDRDKAQCEYEAMQATQQIDYGYKTIFGQELDRSLRQKRLIDKCMQIKGYHTKTQEEAARQSRT